jgi:hypothetical protein
MAGGRTPLGGISGLHDPELVLHIGCIAIETANMNMWLGLNLSLHEQPEPILDYKSFGEDTREKVKRLGSRPVTALVFQRLS